MAALTRLHWTRLQRMYVVINTVHIVCYFTMCNIMCMLIVVAAQCNIHGHLEPFPLALVLDYKLPDVQLVWEAWQRLCQRYRLACVVHRENSCQACVACQLPVCI